MPIDLGGLIGSDFIQNVVVGACGAIPGGICALPGLLCALPVLLGILPPLLGLSIAPPSFLGMVLSLVGCVWPSWFCFILGFSLCCGVGGLPGLLGLILGTGCVIPSACCTVLGVGGIILGILCCTLPGMTCCGFPGILGALPGMGCSLLGGLGGFFLGPEDLFSSLFGLCPLA